MIAISLALDPSNFLLPRGNPTFFLQYMGLTCFHTSSLCISCRHSVASISDFSLCNISDMKAPIFFIDVCLWPFGKFCESWRGNVHVVHSLPHHVTQAWIAYYKEMMEVSHMAGLYSKSICTWDHITSMPDCQLHGINPWDLRFWATSTCLIPLLRL